MRNVQIPTRIRGKGKALRFNRDAPGLPCFVDHSLSWNSVVRSSHRADSGYHSRLRDYQGSASFFDGGSHLLGVLKVRRRHCFVLLARITHHIPRHAVSKVCHYQLGARSAVPRISWKVPSCIPSWLWLWLRKRHAWSCSV